MRDDVFMGTFERVCLCHLEGKVGREAGGYVGPVLLSKQYCCLQKEEALAVEGGVLGQNSRATCGAP